MTSILRFSLIRRITLLSFCILIWGAMFVGGGPSSSLDRQAYLTLYERGDIDLIRIVTAFGGWETLVPAALAGGAYLLWMRRFRDAALLLAITLGARLVVSIQKALIDQPRPDLQDHLVAVSSASFPSGHAANGMVTWLTLALLLPQRQRASLALTAIAIAILIGLSRVALGVHWPSDVIGGWFFGLAWVLAIFGWTREVPSDRSSF